SHSQVSSTQVPPVAAAVPTPDPVLPAKRKVFPRPASNTICAPQRGVGFIPEVGVLFAHAVPSHSQVSFWRPFTSSEPPNRTIRLRVLSQTIAAPNRGDGPVPAA